MQRDEMLRCSEMLHLRTPCTFFHFECCVVCRGRPSKQQSRKLKDNRERLVQVILLLWLCRVFRPVLALLAFVVVRFPAPAQAATCLRCRVWLFCSALPTQQAIAPRETSASSAFLGRAHADPLEACFAPEPFRWLEEVRVHVR